MYRFCAIVILLALIAVGAQSVLAGDATREEPLVVVHSDNTPPLSFVGYNGEPKGLVIDYWRAWSLTTGIPIKIVQVSWPETLEMVRDGRADIHGGLYYSDERGRFLDFSDPFFTLEAAIYVRKSLDIRTMNQLGDLVVAVLNQGYSEYYLKRHHPEVNIRVYDSSNLMAEAAMTGEVHALLTEKTTLVHQLGSQGMLDEFVALDTLYRRDIRGAVAAGNQALLKRIREGEIKLSSRDRDKIFSQWVVLGSSTSGWLVVALVAGFIALAGAALFAIYPRTG